MVPSTSTIPTATRRRSLSKIFWIVTALFILAISSGRTVHGFCPLLLVGHSNPTQRHLHEESKQQSHPADELAWCNNDRRTALSMLLHLTSAMMMTTTTRFLPPSLVIASARTPGSTDTMEAIQQIRDGADELRKLLQNWDDYASIDAEGRAGNTNGARRMLGGIAPQAGTAAIEAAKTTPLYRIDGAFTVLRKAILDESAPWASSIDLDIFEELTDRIQYNVQKADGDFYGVLFASKGTKMINDIFVEAKGLVKQGIRDLDKLIELLQQAGAPGL